MNCMEKLKHILAPKNCLQNIVRQGSDKARQYNPAETPNHVQVFLPGRVQGSAKRWVQGSVNNAGKVRQKWKATAVTRLTKPGAHLRADLCTITKSPLLKAMLFPSHDAFLGFNDRFMPSIFQRWFPVPV